MRRAIIHIGTPRTGTTSLQRLLFSHRDRLLEAGVLYPDLTPRSAPFPHTSHQYLGETLDGRRPARERRELLAKLEDAVTKTEAEVVLLSYERFCLLRPRHAAAELLCRLLEGHGFRPEILMTLRPQATYILSHYMWRIQFLREARSFRDAFPRELGAPRYDYLRCLEGWGRAAQWRVSAVPVQDRRSSAPMLERIATELRLPALLRAVPAADLTFRANQSLGPVATEVSRRLRRSGVARDLATSRSITDRIAALAREHGLDAGSFWGLDDDMLERARQRFAGADEAFAQRVWGEAWTGRVPPVRPAAVNELAGRQLDPDLAGRLDQIRAAVAAEFGLRPASPPRLAWQRLREGAATGFRSLASAFGSR